MRFTTKSVLRLLIAVVASGSFYASAQTPTPAPKPSATPPPETKESAPLDGNYALTLYPAGKDGAQICVVVAKPEFSVQNEKPFMRFSGRLLPQEGGNYLVEYVLLSADDKMSEYVGTATTTNASVLLRLGEPAQIVKNSTQFYNLRLDRYQATTPVKVAGPAGAANVLPGGVH